MANITSIIQEQLDQSKNVRSLMFPSSLEDHNNYDYFGPSLKSLIICGAFRQESIVFNYGYSKIGTVVILDPNQNSLVTTLFRNPSGYKQKYIKNLYISTSVGKYQVNSSFDSISFPSLKWLRMDSPIATIDREVFYSAPKILSIRIPRSVTNISMGNPGVTEPAFRSYYLEDIEVEPGNSTYDSRNDCNAIIETSTNTLLIGCKNTRIPNGVTSIRSGAFYECGGPFSITIPDSMTTIGNGAFYRVMSNGNGLTSVTIPNTVTSIGQNAFRDSQYLASINIPSGLTSIGSYAFMNCVRLQSPISIPTGVTRIEEHTFHACQSIPSVSFPNTLAYIGAYAFEDCFSLTSVTIPDSVTSIGEYAFKGCSGLTSVTIPDSVTSIGQAAFYNLTSISVPSHFTEQDLRDNYVIPDTCQVIIRS